MQRCSLMMAAPGQGITPALLELCSHSAAASCGASIDFCLHQGIVRGKLKDGAPCGQSSQCASGSCSNTSSGVVDGCGQCSPTTAAPSATPCGSNLAGCDWGTHCEDGSCVPTLAGKEGAPCADRGFICEVGLECVPPFGRGDTAGDTSGYVCRALVTEGGACSEPTGDAPSTTNAGHCLPPLRCVRGTCTRPGNFGDTCKNGCGPSLVCERKTHDDVDGMCVPIAFGPANATCDLQSERCTRGWCTAVDDKAAGRCVDPVADGASCFSQIASGSPTSAPTCDVGADCVDHKCQIFDPASCR